MIFRIFASRIVEYQKQSCANELFFFLTILYTASALFNATESVKTGRESECDVANYLKKAGFSSSEVPVMVCISKYESSFNCGAKNTNTDGSIDYGLMQINDYYWCSGGDSQSDKYDECNTSCSKLMDCQRNANCARTVYKQQGYTAWYGYQYHKEECDNYQIDC